MGRELHSHLELLLLITRVYDQAFDIGPIGQDFFDEGFSEGASATCYED
jgi:hypothetical protein